MATLQQDILEVRQAVYGRDVREAIADGFEHMLDVKNEFDSIKTRMTAVETKLNDLGLSVVNGAINTTFNT